MNEAAPRDVEFIVLALDTEIYQSFGTLGKLSLPSSIFSFFLRTHLCCLQLSRFGLRKPVQDPLSSGLLCRCYCC